MSDVHWIHGTADTEFPPPNAVIGGTDSDGSIILVGRAHHCGDQLTAKVILARKDAYVSYGGLEIPITSFEFLTGRGFKWVMSKNGDIPKFAVTTGRTNDGEQLFIGRVHYNSSLTVGKIHRSHNCCYFPYGGLEISAKSYEVLVQYPQASWISDQKFSQTSDSPVLSGCDTNGFTIYVGRGHYHDNVVPAKVVVDPEGRTHFLISSNGREVIITHEHKCEVLCGSGFSWIKSRSGIAHANAVVGGHTVNGETVYIGRVNHEKSVTPGMIRPSHGCLYIPYGGAELKFIHYEILVQN